MSATETPRTDAISYTFRDYPARARDLDALARTLERELATARQDLEDCQRLALSHIRSSDAYKDILIEERMVEARLRFKLESALITARQDALEEAAKVCESMLINRPDDPPANYYDGGLRAYSAAIRALQPAPEPNEKPAWTKHDPADGQARWVSEREQAVAILRQVCEKHGDNEWDETLHLADVVEKHLWRHLEGPR